MRLVTSSACRQIAAVSLLVGSLASANAAYADALQVGAAVSSATLSSTSAERALSELLPSDFLITPSATGLTLQRIDLRRDPNGATRVSMVQIQLNTSPVGSANAAMTASCNSTGCQTRLESTTSASIRGK